MFNFRKDRVNWKEELGKGSFGKVFPYKSDKDDKAWVVKVIAIDNDEKLINSIEEIVFGFGCDHPNIVPIKGFFIEKTQGQEHPYKIYLKLPRMKHTLKEKIIEDAKIQGSYPEDVIVRYFYSLVCSLDYLHKRKIAHRDIKPLNLMLDEDGNLMVCDIGNARMVMDEEASKTDTNRDGPLAYAAPEVKNNNYHLKKKAFFKSDAWSLGLTILELCLKKLNIYQWMEVSEEKREDDLKKHLASLEGQYSKWLLEMVAGLLIFDTSKRKDIAESKKELERRHPALLKMNRKARNAHEEEKQNLESYNQENFDEEHRAMMEYLIDYTERLNVEDNEKNAEDSQVDTQAKERVQKLLDKFPEAMILQNELNAFSTVQYKTSEFTNEELKNFIKEVTSSVTDLQQLDLTLSSASITDAGLIGIGKELSSTLKNLSLSLDGGQITDACVGNFVSEIGTNDQVVQGLTLTLCNLGMTDDGPKNLGDKISDRFKLLQNLNLTFKSTKISDEGFKSLINPIGSHLKSLQSLALSFNSNEISEKSLESLAGQFVNLQSLTRLSLYFLSNKITDDGIEALASSITEHLGSLENLSLNFRSEQITDKGITSLAAQIGKIFEARKEKPFNLSIVFDSQKITKEGAKSLVQQTPDLAEYKGELSLKIAGVLIKACYHGTKMVVSL